MTSKEWAKKYPERMREYTRQSRARRQTAEAGRPKPTVCEVCGRSEERIHFDHDHATGKFRGWLCHSCNAALGMVRDDPEILLSLIRYLERGEAVA